MTGVLVATAIVLGVAVAVRDRPSPTAATVTTTTTTTTPPSTRRQGTPIRNCDERIGTVSGKPQWDTPPAMAIDTAKKYRATMETTKGTIAIDLDPAAAPATVNNFVFLARCGFYDGITFHRIAKNFVIQAGDPTGSGRGGPGYTFADELPPAPGYPVGSVAMANSGPDTNGSQFFIVTGPGAAQLPNNYSRFGTVVEGQDTAKAIEDLPVQGGGSDGKPQETVTITSVTVEER